MQTAIVIPNWNGEASLSECLDSLLHQTVKATIILVDNGSVDGSVALVEKQYPTVEIIRHDENKGYAGGVNPGFKRAIELGADYVAPFNNDATADPAWLEKLVSFLDKHTTYGIATCLVLDAEGEHIDSTGEYYSTWGLPYPRGRGETDARQYEHMTEVFGGSGSSSLYRVSMLKEIGLLDEDFFAYYEDVDISFRAQLLGWRVAYVPDARIYHDTGSTGKRIKGFYTYQTMKNLPLLLVKNVPRRLMSKVLPRFLLAYIFFFGAAVQRHHTWHAIKGCLRATGYLPKKLKERHGIQKSSVVSAEYIASLWLWDLPPNAARLRKVRGYWWKLTGRKAA